MDPPYFKVELATGEIKKEFFIPWDNSNNFLNAFGYNPKDDFIYGEEFLRRIDLKNNFDETPLSNFSSSGSGDAARRHDLPIPEIGVTGIKSSF